MKLWFCNKLVGVGLALLFLTQGCKPEQTNLDRDTSADSLDVPAKVIKDNLSIGNKNNALWGITFRNVTEIDRLKNFKDMGGSVMGPTDANGNYNFGIAELGDSSGNYFLIFERFIYSKGPNPRYQILDTLNIQNLKESEGITYCSCRKDSVLDDAILAIVEGLDSEVYNRVIRAWRADTKTGIISPVSNLSGIVCSNDGYSNCPEDSE
jgi:hypothetical protein